MCLSTPLRARSQVVRTADDSPTVVVKSLSSQKPSELSNNLPTKDEAIGLIKSNRWWDPALGTEAPLNILFSHNKSQSRGWLRSLLFPNANESKFDEQLTFAYLLTVAEIEGLAPELTYSWDESLSSSDNLRMSTIGKFAYHPILFNFPVYQKSVEAILYLWDLFPAGCLETMKGNEYLMNEKLAMVFLDAALFRRGAYHGQKLRRLFNCSSMAIGRFRNAFLDSLFSQCTIFEDMAIPVPPTSLTSPPLADVSVSVANRRLLEASRVLKPTKNRRLKRQVSSSFSKENTVNNMFKKHKAGGGAENCTPQLLTAEL